MELEERRLAIELRGSDSEGEARLVRAECAIPGAVLVDTSEFAGELRIAAGNELAVLREPLRVAAPYPERVELVLEARGRLVLVLPVPVEGEGLVFLEQGGEASPGDLMVLFRARGSCVDAWRPGGSLRGTGSFALRSLAPGEYRVHAVGYGYASSPYLEVRLPSPRPVEVPLLRAGRLGVRWIDGAGRALSFRLAVHDRDGHRLYADGPNQQHQPRQRTLWLAPDAYTLRLEGLEGQVLEHPIELEAGEAELVLRAD